MCVIIFYQGKIISNIPVFTILQIQYTFIIYTKFLNYICCTICSFIFTILVVHVVVQVYLYFHWHAESSSFQRLEIHSRDVFFYLPNCWLYLASISHRHHSHHSPVQIVRCNRENKFQAVSHPVWVCLKAMIEEKTTKEE